MTGVVADPYPLGLLLTGRRVLVVGGGTVATRRVPPLLAAGAEVVLVAPVITPALRGLAEAGRLTWHERGFVRADVDRAWLVHAALDDPAVAAEVSVAAEERRIFCVRADDRAAATAWTPAVTRHGPVTVAVLGGGDPRRSMAVRDGIAAALTAGTLATAVSAAPGGSAPEAPARAGGSEAAGVTDAPGGRTAGSVALVGGGPGDPELITVKGRRLLAEATVVVADRLAPSLLLDELGPHVELVDASKLPYGPAASQDAINALLVDRALAGHRVVRLKGGDPYVFGRGGEELIACVAAGVPVSVVPGVTSAIAAPAAAGIPVTHRGVAHEFVVVSGHLAPGDPGSLVDWAALGRLRGTVCVLMGLRHLREIVGALLAGGRAADTPAAAVREGTTPNQALVRATLAALPGAVEAAGVRAPAVVVIGEVVGALEAAATSGDAGTVIG